MDKIFKQLHFPHNILKRIMEVFDLSDDWHRQIKLMLIFPLTLIYDELEEPSFQSCRIQNSHCLTIMMYGRPKRDMRKKLEFKYQQKGWHQHYRFSHQKQFIFLLNSWYSKKLNMWIDIFLVAAHKYAISN